MIIAKRKGIVFYTESPVTGGVSAVVEEIAVAASSLFDCAIVCQDGSSLRIWGESLQTNKVTVVHTALKNKADVLGWFEVLVLARLYRKFRQADIVHFHLHTTFSCLPAIFVARLLARKPVLITEHYIAQLRFMRNRRLFFPLALLREFVLSAKLLVKRLSLRLVTQVITVSNANRRFFLSTFGSTYADIVTSIPNGIDVERFAPDSAAHSNGAEVDSSTVTTIAGLNNQKGHEYLIRAIPTIKQRCPDVKFIFAGEGHLRNYLERLAQTEGVADIISFVGQINDVRPLLIQSTLVVLPSLFEGMPMSVLEALAAGRAVVATNVDGTSEVVLDGFTGFLVPPQDPDQLAQKIVHLLQDRSLREIFGRNGQERVKAEFSLERMAKAYCELYKQLLDQKHQQA